MKRSNHTIVILAHVFNNTVTNGFIPAAKALGLHVVLLTDCPLEHHEFYANAPISQQLVPDQTLTCDVFNQQAIIELLLEQSITPHAVFTNSDHLQTACALTAAYFGLPGKDWQICYRAKNKSAMRQHLANLSIQSAQFISINQIEQLQTLTLPFPVVVKPQQGIASIDVKLCGSLAELREFCLHFWQKYPNQGLLVEEYLQGQLFTLETLGDGKQLCILGGFNVDLANPPYFIEKQANWLENDSIKTLEQACLQIQDFGVNFGACHSEFVLTNQGPKLIEINYRSIGGGKEFLLDKLLDGQYFEQVIKLHLGEPIAIPLPIKGYAHARYYTADSTGTLTFCPSAFENNQPCNVKLDLLKQQGTYITKTYSDRDRIAILSAFAKQSDQLTKTAFDQAIAQYSKELKWEIN